ncbi:uncharacterized protein LOC133307985 [Gastrolobium bilobum]|uniref:uncharacterized protein LOC133307985 n=1 Tax=Gastrolobium bilobum TaxID=150636 RepID=UPI002AAF4121|nr:uncharacterized protein LOC133307985 [Gastrolobium bilobum]
MGNCASNPKTNEGDAPLPEPVTEEVKVEQQENKVEENAVTKTEETPEASDEKSLSTLLNEKEAEKVEAKTEEAKVEAKTEEVKVEAVVVAKPETKQEETPAAKAEN